MKSDKYNSIKEELRYRLEQFIRKLHSNQKEFAEKIGVSESQLSEILKGKRFPGYKFFEKLAYSTNANINWLITGEGEMSIENQADILSRDFGEQGKNIAHLLKICKQSPLVKLHLQAWAHNFLLQNDELIKKDIEKNKRNQFRRN